MKIKEISAAEESSLMLKEGTVLHPYYDTKGVPTIGCGTTIYPNGKRVTMKDPPITKEQAIDFMRTHLKKEVYPYIQKFITQELNQNQYDALCSFMYNLGPQALINKDNSPTRVRIRINQDPSDPKIKDAMLLFDRKDPALQKRHAAEADLFLTPMP